jgi:hypothetical protein
MSTLNKFYVIRNNNPDAGMGSLLSSVIGHLKIAESENRIPVVDWNFYECLYKEKEPVLKTLNPWEYYFEPVAKFRIIDLSDYDDVFYTTGDHPQNMPFPWAKLPITKEIFKKYIRLNVQTHEYIELRINQLAIKFQTLGVHFRAARGMRINPNHPIQPTRSQIYALIDRELNTARYDQIFFATDVEEEIHHFKKRYGNLLVNFQSSRFKREESLPPKIPGFRNLHSYLLGLEVLTEAYALSRCGGLIAGFSGVSQLGETLRLPDRSYQTLLIDNGKLSHYKFIAKYQFAIKSKIPAFLGGFQ